MRKATKVRVGIEKEGWKVIRDLGTATQIGRVEVMIQCSHCGAVRRIGFDNFIWAPPKKCPGCYSRVRGVRGFRGLAGGVQKTKRKAMPEAWAAKREAGRKELEHREYVKYYAALYGAYSRGLAWELSPSDFAALRASACVYCGEPGDTVGVDRVDNDSGYTKLNAVPCCTDCNRMKWAHSREAFLARVRKIAAHAGAAGEPEAELSVGRPVEQS